MAKSRGSRCSTACCLTRRSRADRGQRERTLTYGWGCAQTCRRRSGAERGHISFGHLELPAERLFLRPSLVTALRNDGTMHIHERDGQRAGSAPRAWRRNSSYSGIKYATFRVSGAYTDAKYVDYQFAGQPSENANLAVKYRDISGFTLPNAPKVQFNATATYRRAGAGRQTDPRQCGLHLYVQAEWRLRPLGIWLAACLRDR